MPRFEVRVATLVSIFGKGRPVSDQLEAFFACLFSCHLQMRLADRSSSLSTNTGKREVGGPDLSAIQVHGRVAEPRLHSPCDLRQVVRLERLWETRGSRLPLRGVIRLWIAIGSLWNLDRPRQRSPTGRGPRAVSAEASRP